MTGDNGHVVMRAVLAVFRGWRQGRWETVSKKYSDPPLGWSILPRVVVGRPSALTMGILGARSRLLRPVD